MTAPIRRRTRAREIAMQVLFQFDVRGDGYPGEVGSVTGRRENQASLHLDHRGALLGQRRDARCVPYAHPREVDQNHIAMGEVGDRILKLHEMLSGAGKTTKRRLE